MRRRRKLHAKHPCRPVNSAASQTVAQPSKPMPPPVSRRTAPTARINSAGNWYRIENSASSGVTGVYIYDEIGFWGVSASDFMDALRQINTGVIELHLNSPGGDVFDGIAIYNCLRAHKARVDVVVDSLAASAASVIAQAGDTITMMPGSQIMIHEASGLCMGNAEDMAEMARMLDQQSDNIAGIYAQAAGGERDEWRTRMKAETWYMAEEAVEIGLADRVAVDEPSEDDAPAARRRPEARAQAQVPAPVRDEVPAPAAVAQLPERETAPDAPPLVLDFAAAFAPLPEPEPDVIALGWDWTAVAAGVTGLMEAAPAPREQPTAAPPPPPVAEIFKFDRAGFRNALRFPTLEGAA